MLQLAALRVRSNVSKDLEIVVLRHELAILQRRTHRPAITWTDRIVLTAASQLLPRVHWRSFIITPATLLRWHRRLVASGGRMRVMPAARRFAVSVASWPFDSRERIRCGAINASSAN
jgi:hypothetical protein